MKATYILGGLAVAIFIGALLFTGNLSGVSYDNPQYSSATNTSVECSGATSTLVAAASVSRNSFELTASSSDVTLCKAASGCVSGSGLIIEADEYWSQDDGYVGAYSCIGQSNTTSTINLIYSQ